MSEPITIRVVLKDGKHDVSYAYLSVMAPNLVRNSEWHDISRVASEVYTGLAFVDFDTFRRMLYIEVDERVQPEISAIDILGDRIKELFMH